MMRLSRYNLRFSIAILSAAIIAFQLSLIQILSYVQWYHFAYMVISVALLGFGAAGTFIALFRKSIVEHIDLLLPLLMVFTGITMSLVTALSQKSFIRFDSYLLFADYSHIGRLLLTYLLFFIPFFLGALAIGLVFVKYVDDIGKIYFSNLLGSGIGGILAFILPWLLFPRQQPAVIAILPMLAALMIIPKNRRVLHGAFGAIGVVVIVWTCLYPPQLVLPEYKDLNKTLLLPEAKITLEKTSPYGVIQMVSSPVLRYAPGMSLISPAAVKIKMAAFLNAEWFGAVTHWKRSDSSIILDYTTSALPFIMAKRNEVLVLRSGMGMDVAHAFSRKANKIVAVEPNSAAVSILKDELAATTDSLFFINGISLENLEPRTFLLMDTARYDLITLPMVGTFGGSSGLYALQEQFLLTKEAFREMWFKLNKRGVISVTAWMDYPVRNPLKILATMVEVLTDLGIQNPTEHIAAIRSWGTITFVVSRSSLQSNEISNIRNFCDEMLFDPAILPGLNVGERTQYNQFQEDRFFDYLDKILSADRNDFYADYDFNIRPATDNQPYFSQYIKWSSLGRLSGFFGNRSLPFFGVGYLLVVITLIQISIVSIVLIILPLFRMGWKGKDKLSVILYFGGIGLGYMFVEMVFIQRFILYFGNSVYSAAAVITSLLIFSGIGSYYSGYFTFKRKRLMLIFAAIVMLLFALSFVLTPLLRHTVDSGIVLKLTIVFLLTAPLAFCMGIPFPAGLSHVAKVNAPIVPWAWGINGCVSVISAVLATIIAVEAGFTWVMLLAGLSYCLPFLVQATGRYD